MKEWKVQGCTREKHRSEDPALGLNTHGSRQRSRPPQKAVLLRGVALGNWWN
jgi:hypothetical protein